MNKLKAGSGYWRLNVFSIGGDFRRVDEDTEIISIDRIYPPANTTQGIKSLRGCSHAVTLANNDLAAIRWNDVITG